MRFHSRFTAILLSLSCVGDSCTRHTNRGPTEAPAILKVRANFTKPIATVDRDIPEEQALDRTVSKLEASATDRHSLQIYRSARAMIALLESDELCADYFGGIEVVKAVIGQLAKQNLVGHSEFDRGIAAFVGIFGTDLEAGSAALVVNRAGPFFSSGFDVAGRPGNTDQARLHIWLHELCHLVDKCKPDYGSAADVAANDRMVVSKCAASLRTVVH